MAPNTPRVSKNDFARPTTLSRAQASKAKGNFHSKHSSFDRVMNKSEEKFTLEQNAQTSSKSDEKKQAISDKPKSLSAETKKDAKKNGQAEEIAHEIENQNLEQEVISELPKEKDEASDQAVLISEPVLPLVDLEPIPIIEGDKAVVETDTALLIGEIESTVQEIMPIIEADDSKNAEKLMAEVDLLTMQSVIKSDDSDTELKLTKKEVKLLADAVESLKEYVETQKGETSPELDKLNSMVKQLNGVIVSNKTTKNVVPEQIADKTHLKLSETNQGVKKNVDTALKSTSEIRLDQAVLETSNTESSNSTIETIKTSVKTAVFEQVKAAIIKEPITVGEQSEMIIKLKPEELGKVELKIEVHNDIVIAKFDVASQMVKEVIESNLEDLRNSLKDKGFEDLTFDVNVNKDNQEQQQGQTGKYRRRINLETSAEEGNESYVKSLSAMINDNAFEHLA